MTAGCDSRIECGLIRGCRLFGNVEIRGTVLCLELRRCVMSEALNSLFGVEGKSVVITGAAGGDRF
jgi:hypothetical protein